MQRISSASIAVTPTWQQRLRMGLTADPLLISKLYYFVFFASIGPWVSFFNIYLEGRGLTGQQIGLIGTMAPLITLIANPFWSALADRWQIHRGVLVGGGILTGVVALSLTQAQSFIPLLVLTMLLFFMRAPLPILVDTSTMETVRRIGGSYGRQRLWGSIGFILVSFFTAQWIGGRDLTLIFWVHALMVGVICSGLALLLPMERKLKRVNLVAGLREMSHRPGYLSFLAAMVLAGMSLAGNSNFYSLYMMKLGGTEAQVGAGWALNAVLEIPVMFLGAAWFARHGNRKLLGLSLLGFVALWITMGLAPSSLFLLTVTPLMGAFFAIFWMAIVGYAADMAPEGMNATSQGLVSAGLSGLGWGLGSLLAGTLWDAFGGQAIYFTSAGLMAGAYLLFWWGGRAKG